MNLTDLLLMAVLRDHGDMLPLGFIKEQMDKLTDKDHSLSTLQDAAERLVRARSVTPSRSAVRDMRGGKARMLLTLTTEGATALKQAREAMSPPTKAPSPPHRFGTCKGCNAGFLYATEPDEGYCYTCAWYLNI